jgi:acylglycerol lipase
MDPEANKAFCERSRSQLKTLKLYEGFYYDLLHEPEKQAVLNDMSNWLEKHS